MLLLLLLLLRMLPLGGCSQLLDQDQLYKDRLLQEAVAATTRPYIHNCRSPNMEDFSCWWHPLDNLTEREPVRYVLSYSIEKGPWLECPDYESAGANSCHFDSRHTSVWKIYCMKVTAVTALRNYSSPEHCLDVGDVVQTEAPVNLTHNLTDAGGDEVGHSVLLSWAYPAPAHLRFGWITLVYELQYRRASEPDNWKVKHPLREPHVKLLGLPEGDYMVRVRCRSHNDGLWSKWSSTLLMSIPGRQPAGKLLVRILVSGVGVVALLGIAFGVIPQSKRIKEYFLPPIPKPRIIGIDPLLLKKGNLDQINHHFSHFHSYRPPSYTEEVWEHVNADDVYLTAPRDYAAAATGAGQPDPERDALVVPLDPAPVAARYHFTAQNLTAYVQSLSPYCTAPPLDTPSPWPRPEIVSLPGTDYSMMGRGGGVPGAAPAPAGRSPQDFYTCVQLMNDSGEVHLVPCLPPAYCRDPPPPPREAGDTEEERRKLEQQVKHGGEAAAPLLPLANQG
ncbi:uncharacterized protein V6R79_016232 [Siganus canaliculatus]